MKNVREHSFKLKLKKRSKTIKISGLTNSQYKILKSFTMSNVINSSLLIDSLYNNIPLKLQPKDLSNGLYYVIEGLNKKLADQGLVITGLNRGTLGKYYWIEKI